VQLAQTSVEFETRMNASQQIGQDGKRRYFPRAVEQFEPRNKCLTDLTLLVVDGDELIARECVFFCLRPVGWSCG
jgi:hypothetical protein